MRVRRMRVLNRLSVPRHFWARLTSCRGIRAMREQLTEACLPADRDRATLVGRMWVPRVGPTVVCVRGDDVCDLSSIAPTMSQLLERPDAATVVRNAEQLPKVATV